MSQALSQVRHNLGLEENCSVAVDNILIGSMHSKSQKLNNDCYKVVEKPSAVGSAQTGTHKNWILI